MKRTHVLLCHVSTDIKRQRRWYGDGMPSTCFMERKTHRESWKGEESVKDRFTVPEAEMLNFLVGEWTLDKARKDLEKKVRDPWGCVCMS